ncbi:TadE/TadG family type IV pilus assembly protein [Peristeroidobacter agariperforans]|uniref:TadE/TadG family type IV pilus assembly protein n=1 Tax=Peristeroidobacter agariperforans TaxID=268404 RepID=UPI00101D9973|nr:Tad domain-containing protein [Peristeroidobacter agariperforans]
MPLHESPHAQRGVVAVLIAIAMSALILTAGLALDMGHAFLNKTRLQNAVDAAALAAAKTLTATEGNIIAAEAEAFDAFTRNAETAGNRELEISYGSGDGDLDVAVEFSATLPPFAAGAPNGPYVRVRATGFVMPAWLVSVGGIFEKTVSATAVAGPRTLNAGSTVCNLAPMMVCGSPGGPGMWGYENNEAVVLKNATPGGQSTVGPGNFQLIRLGAPGGSVVLQNMAGSYSACLAGGTTIETQPGGLVGPVAQGLNTRFGRYQGPVNATEYPPDVIVEGQSPEVTARPRDERDLTQGYDVYQGGDRITPENIRDRLFDYRDYEEQLNNEDYDYPPITDGGTGAFGRRVLAVPVGDCSGTVGGAGSVPLLGFACFFLLQPVQMGGTVSNVFGQFVDDCSVNGTPGPNPVTSFGPQIIQLYDDPASNDS